MRIGDAMKSGLAFFGRAGLALAVVFTLSLSAPAADPAGRAAAGTVPSPRPIVVASLFPQYDFARVIGGGKADVRLLLPPGAESHSYEPTPSDMKAIAGADLFLYTGPDMEPWAKRVVDAASGDGGPAVVNLSARVPGPPDAHGDHGDDEALDRDGHAHAHDPHIWLDPVIASSMAEAIHVAMADLDPANAETYARNADALRRDLAALDEHFRAVLEWSPRRTLVFGERFAFAWFFDRYGLDVVGAYKSCAPGAEPGVKAVIDVVKYIGEHGVRHVYAETTSPGRISEVLRRETGVDVLTVDSLHNVPLEPDAGGSVYVAVMRANMDAFAEGLQ